MTAPAPLQVLSEASASAWFLHWAGVTGRVAARATTSHRGSSAPLTQHSNLYSIPAFSQPNNTLISIPQLCHRKTNKREQTTKDKLQCINNTSLSRQRRMVILEHEVSDISSMNFPQPSKLQDSPQLEHLLIPSNASDIPALSSQLLPRLDTQTVKQNATKCAVFLKAQVPPLLIDKILLRSWQSLTEFASGGGYSEEPTAPHQLADWAHKAPTILHAMQHLTNRKFALDISGLANDYLEPIVIFIDENFPVETLNRILLPSVKFKSGKKRDEISGCVAVLKRIISRSSVLSLRLNSNFVDDDMLHFLTKLPLRELDIEASGGLVSEAGIIQGFCQLPHHSANEAFNDFHKHVLQNKSSPLRQSLTKLTISLHNISNSMYHVILLAFPHLQYYKPYTNMIQCVRKCAEIQARAEQKNKTLQLLHLNMGSATRNVVRELSRICPNVREICINIEADPDETLDALQSFEKLSDLQVNYYPSPVSSNPKLNSSVLIPLLTIFKQQLQCLSVSGFSINAYTVYALSQLPALRSLQIKDSWIARPKTVPPQPFPNLESLSLQNLPDMCLMQLFTAGCQLRELSLSTVASDWAGNALTDHDTKQLVLSGLISTVEYFSAESASLSLESLKTLSLLPSVSSMGRMGCWGLSQEELRCVAHSGLPHILCRH